MKIFNIKTRLFSYNNKIYQHQVLGRGLSFGDLDKFISEEEYKHKNQFGENSNLILVLNSITNIYFGELGLSTEGEEILTFYGLFLEEIEGEIPKEINNDITNKI